MNLKTTLRSDTATPMAILSIEGDLDYLTNDSAIEAVRRLLEQSPTVAELHLDCANLTFCDSAGLSALLVMHDQATSRGVRFEVTHRPAHLERLLDITGIHDFFVTSTVKEDSSAETDAPVAERGQH